MTKIAKKKERERVREYTPVIGVNFLKFWFQKKKKTAISHKKSQGNDRPNVNIIKHIYHIYIYASTIYIEFKRVSVFCFWFCPKI